MMWLSLSLEIMYVGLLLVSWPGRAPPGPAAHMMFMVFQTTASMGPEDFKPHSYGYSWAFYVAWFAFTVCMSAGVSTLNNYTKKVLMAAPRPVSGLLLPRYAAALAGPPSPPRISHLSPNYEPPAEARAAPRLAHSGSLPLPRDHSFPPPSLHRLSLPSPSPPPTPTFSVRPPGQEESRRGPEEFCGPL